MVENVARADVAGWLLRVLPERWQGPVRLIRPTSCDKPWDKPAQIGRESGGIGRRGRLKICCPSKTWGFESPLSHHASLVSKSSSGDRASVRLSTARTNA